MIVSKLKPNKLKISAVFLLCILSAFIFSSCKNNDASENTAEPSVSEHSAISQTSLASSDEVFYSTYNVHMDVDPENNTITAAEKVTWKNTSSETLSELYMEVYANAFNDKDAVFPSRFKSTGGQSSFKITALTIDGYSVKYALSGTILRILPSYEITPGQTVEIALQFDLSLPKTNYYIAKGENAVWCGGAIPVMAAYRNSAWVYDKSNPADPSFTNDVSNYEVTITCDKEYTVASTGEEIVSEAGGRKMTSISTRMVRGFGFSLMKNWSVTSSETSGGVVINIYHSKDNADAINSILNMAKQSIEFYSLNVGSYPYQSVDIVESRLFDMGFINYSGFVLADTGLFSDGLLGSEKLSLGQQWFGNIIGTQSPDDWFFYDGLTSFIKTYSCLTGLELKEQMTRDYEEVSLELKNRAESLGNGAYWKYSSPDEYSLLSAKSRLMFYSLYREIGDADFFEALKEFYSRYSFKTASPEDFFDICSEITGTDLMQFYTSWGEQHEMPAL